MVKKRLKNGLKTVKYLIFWENPTATDDGFEISCTLGECAMSHAIEDNM